MRKQKLEGGDLYYGNQEKESRQEEGDEEEGYQEAPITTTFLPSESKSPSSDARAFAFCQ